jgi:DNA-binding CsgD family transcriptional regulator
VNLLEREAERATLSEAIAVAAQGMGRLVIVEAGPGMGKTELLAEGAWLCRQAGLRVVRARGGELERDFPFGVVRQLFEQPLAAAGMERDRLLSGAAGKCAALFDPVAMPTPAAESQGMFGLLHGLYWLTVNLAQDTGIVLIIDDAHWSDPQSLAFVGFLHRRIDTLGVTFLLATRPDGTGDPVLGQLLADPAATVLQPRPLSGEAVGDLVRVALGEPADKLFCTACHEATRGNPLFIRELLRALAADAVTPAAEAVAAVRSAGPGTVARYVYSRVGLLRAQARELAEAVAVLGDGEDLPIVAELAGMDERVAGEVAVDLVQQGIFERAVPPSFAHPLVREAVYRAMPPTARSLAHGRAASLLAGAGVGAERAAAHVLHTTPAGDARHVGILLDGARAIRDRGIPEAAAVYLARARAEPPPEPLRSEVSRILGNCEAYSLGFTDADCHLREALRLARSPGQRALSAFSLARFRNACGEPGEAIGILLTALSGLTEADDPLLAVRMEAELIGFARVSTSHRKLLVDRLASFESGQARGQRLWPPYQDVLRAHRAVEAALSGGTAATAGRLAREALAGHRLTPDLSAVYVAAHGLLVSDDLASAERHLEHSLAAATNLGLQLPVAMMQGYLSKVALLRGDMAETQARVAAGLDAAHGPHFALPLLYSSQIEVHIEQADLPGAEAALRESGAAEGPVPESSLYLWLLHARGRLHLARGEYQEALADFLECGRRHERWAPGLLDLSWRSRAAEALARLGDREQAAALVSVELGLAHSFGADRPLGIALTSAAALANGEEAVRLAQQAVAALGSSPAGLDLARAYEMLGTALAALGRRGPSRDALRRAMQLALERRATALAGRARERLAAGGGRPPRMWVTGVRSLTPAERRVAQLAARRLTNRQIAEMLYVTEKTVEAHLSRVYRKLQTSSRTQLTAEFATQTEAE